MAGIKIGTHDGSFHADEALACYFLKKLPAYQNAEIVRTRNADILSDCQIVVDVGAVYDSKKHRYDHHQSTFQETMESLRPNIKSAIRLSSAGLIYHHFGEEIFQVIAEIPLGKETLHEMFSYVYYNFVQEIDAIDNGVPMHSGTPEYNINTHLSARVGKLNPSSKAEDTSNTMELFEKAMKLTGTEFEDCAFEFLVSYWPARSLIKDAIEKRFEIHPSGEIIELTSGSWKSHVFELEKRLGIEGKIKFAIYENGDESWSCRAVPIYPESFVLRTPLLKKWQGLREGELQEVCGISGAIFVHATGFIGAATSREGAIALATKTLESYHTSNKEKV